MAFTKDGAPLPNGSAAEKNYLRMLPAISKRGHCWLPSEGGAACMQAVSRADRFPAFLARIRYLRSSAGPMSVDKNAGCATKLQRTPLHATLNEKTATDKEKYHKIMRPLSGA